MALLKTQGIWTMYLLKRRHNPEDFESSEFCVICCYSVSAHQACVLCGWRSKRSACRPQRTASRRSWSCTDGSSATMSSNTGPQVREQTQRWTFLLNQAVVPHIQRCTRLKWRCHCAQIYSVTVNTILLLCMAHSLWQRVSVLAWSLLHVTQAKEM